jgi:NTP pyrophosphatase (non-canonical NTP hydrolase)
MNLSATLRAITTASAAMPAAPGDSMWGRAPHRALPDLAGAELLKKELRRTADRHTTDLADPEARAYLLLGLLGEIGELVTEALRPDPDRAKIISEAGDVLWSLDALLAQHGADLSDAVRALEHKMLTRPTTAPRMAAAGYRPAPTTIAELLQDRDNWRPWQGAALWYVGKGVVMRVDGCDVAILAVDGEPIASATHPTNAAAIRAALDIAAALDPR